jgi:DNA-binding MarR family transcriptional regulator
MVDPLLNLPGYSLRRAASAMGAELTARLAELDLRQVDATVLILIDSEPGTTASAIGRTLDIQRANMVPLLKRLEDMGLIDKHPIDGKSQGLELTETGKARLAAALKTISDFEAELIARVPEEHRDHLLPALNALWR